MSKKALLCGINNYKLGTDLYGCINDVNNMERLLIETFGYEKSNIHSLTNEQVTKVELKLKWEWLLKGAIPGDTLIFHFSGHGSYTIDIDKDEDDGYDELICLHDMDFDDPGTFILDDEWYEMTKPLPDGVSLTIVLDTCHSGDGTRMMEVTNKLGQSLRYAIDPVVTSSRHQFLTGQSRFSVEETVAMMDPISQIAVRARFLEPPNKIGIRRRSSLKGQRKREQKPINHLLLTACKDDQKAADAYISSDNHGAFTYYLCEAVRSAPDKGAREVLNTVIKSLKEQFTQDPQLEGPKPVAPIFGPWKAVTIQDLPVPQNNNGLHTAGMEPKPEKSDELSEDSKRSLIESYAKLLDLVSSPVERAPASRSTGTKHLVYVHGIGQHTEGYSTDWWNALRSHVGTTFGDGSLQENRHEVLWSNLVNSRSTRDRQVDKLRDEILEILEDRRRQSTAPVITTPQDRQLARGSELAIDDFLIYLLDSSIRRRIIDRFTATVRPMLENGNNIDIISHSWGTVVAYEGLCEIAAGSTLQGRVANFFTVGSALSIGPVRKGLREANRNGMRPVIVDQWINVDAQSDIVGGMLGDMFKVDIEHLGMQPTGCMWLLLGYEPGCAHQSYFQKDNLAVNRDIFARYINS